jgi:spermidine synthase
MSDKKYVVETTGGMKIHYEYTERLFSGQSDFQKVEVYDTPEYGKMLFNDDLVMVSERDEFVYHDMITHVPMFTHPNPKKVLIIGGGDGGTAREVLRHKSVEKVDMVEIDGMVVEACRQFIRQTACGMDDDPRFTLYIEDGVKFAKETKETYDVVIVDSSEPMGPSTPLFGPEFYKDLSACMADDGIVVSQGESAYYNQPMQKKLAEILSQQFPIVQYYNYNNLTYPGGLWSFSYASKKYKPTDFNKERVKSSGLEFQYYNAELHTSAFSLPSFQQKMLADYLKC